MWQEAAEMQSKQMQKCEACVSKTRSSVEHSSDISNDAGRQQIFNSFVSLLTNLKEHHICQSSCSAIRHTHYCPGSLSWKAWVFWWIIVGTVSSAAITFSENHCQKVLMSINPQIWWVNRNHRAVGKKNFFVSKTLSRRPFLLLYIGERLFSTRVCSQFDTALWYFIICVSIVVWRFSILKSVQQSQAGKLRCYEKA